MRLYKKPLEKIVSKFNLSTLMERGINRSFPTTGRFIQIINESIYACAIGCGILGVPVPEKITSLFDIPGSLSDLEKYLGYYLDDKIISVPALPLERVSVNYRRDLTMGRQVTLYKFIVTLNDHSNYSREEIARLVKDLGY